MLAAALFHAGKQARSPTSTHFPTLPLSLIGWKASQLRKHISQRLSKDTAVEADDSSGEKKKSLNNPGKLCRAFLLLEKAPDIAVTCDDEIEQLKVIEGN